MVSINKETRWAQILPFTVLERTNLVNPLKCAILLLLNVYVVYVCVCVCVCTCVYMWYTCMYVFVCAHVCGSQSPVSGIFSCFLPYSEPGTCWLSRPAALQSLPPQNMLMCLGFALKHGLNSGSHAFMPNPLPTEPSSFFRFLFFLSSCLWQTLSHLSFLTMEGSGDSLFTLCAPTPLLHLKAWLWVLHCFHTAHL